MTTAIKDIITTIESELRNLITQGNSNTKFVWFGDIDTVTIQTPAVYFILDGRSRGDAQVFQDDKRLLWNLEYAVYCLHSGLEGNQKFTNARKFTDDIANLLQMQHSSAARLNGNCQDIGCISVDYGKVSTNVPKSGEMAGGVISLIVQVIETF